MANYTKEQRECHIALASFLVKRETLILQGVPIKNLPVPPNITEIDGYGLSKEDRKFKKEELPNIIPVKDGKGNIVDTRFDLPEGEEEDYSLKIINKRINGHFFFNKDNLEYITGDHFYYINFCKIPIKQTVLGRKRRVLGNPYFVDSDRDFYYFWEEVRRNPKCFGMMMVSSRRSGKTGKSTATLLNSATLYENTKYGILAQRGDIAKSIFKRLVSIWKELPEHKIFSPTHTGDDSPQAKLDFSKPKKITKTGVRVYKEVLNSYIDWRNTTITSYDSEGMDILYIDEASKVEGCDITELFNVQRETLSDGSDAVGKMIVTSTAENVGGKTLPKFKKLWDKSAYEKRDLITGQTESGMWKFFIPATMGYRHDPSDDGDLDKSLQIETIDKWGYSIPENAEKIIKALRANKSGSDLIQFQRKYPLDEEEAFSYSEAVSPFKLYKLSEQLKINKEKQVFAPITTRGNFIWKDGMRDTEVIWRPDENGRWEMAALPHEHDRNKWKWSGGHRTPVPTEFVSGLDPFDNEAKDESSMSLAASHVYNKISKQFILQYYARPTPNKMYEDMILQNVFCSSRMLPENNKYGVINYFKERGYLGYIIRDPLDDNPRGASLGMANNGSAVRDKMVNVVAEYIYNHVGYSNLSGGLNGRLPFNSLIEDLQKFQSFGKWTPYDLTVSMMYTLIASYERPKPRKMFNNREDFGF